MPMEVILLEPEFQTVGYLTQQATVYYVLQTMPQLHQPVQLLAHQTVTFVHQQPHVPHAKPVSQLEHQEHAQQQPQHQTQTSYYPD